MRNVCRHDVCGVCLPSAAVIDVYVASGALPGVAYGTLEGILETPE